MLFKTLPGLLLLLISGLCWAGGVQDLQRRYQEVQSTLWNIYGIDVEFLAKYRITRLVAPEDWEKAKGRQQYWPERIYNPAPKSWNFWERGNLIAQAAAMKLNRGEPFALDLDFIETLHKTAIDKDMMNSAVRLIEGTAPGMLRGGLHQAHPGYWVTPKHRIDAEKADLIRHYDVSSPDGTPLIFGELVRAPFCDYYWGWMVHSSCYKPGPEIHFILSRISEMLPQFRVRQHTVLTPVELAADTQRDIVALHGFSEGNGRISKYLQDIVLNSQGLPFSPVIPYEVVYTQKKYREAVYQSLKDTVESLENCLNEYHGTLPISLDCRPLCDTVQSRQRTEALTDLSHPYPISCDEYWRNQTNEGLR